jgi:hypothetical protein
MINKLETIGTSSAKHVNNMDLITKKMQFNQQKLWSVRNLEIEATDMGKITSNMVQTPRERVMFKYKIVDLAR